MAALAEARRRRTRTRRFIAAAVAGVLVIAIIGLVVADRRATAKRIERLEAGGCTYDNRSDGDAGQGNNHVANPVYQVDPPAGGNHLAAPARPDVYSITDLPADGNVVHAMEHGDVVLWHQVDIEAAVRDRLIEIYDRYPGDVLVVPRLGLTVPVAATAWHDRLLCPSPDYDALDEFVSTWKDQGPEKIPE